VKPGDRTMVGKLLRLCETLPRRSSTIPEGTLLLVVGTVSVGAEGAFDYVVTYGGITERIPDYWHGWKVIDEAG